MIRSVRVRLALWHTAVLAVVLVAFTAATFAYLRRLMQERTDRSLEEAARAFHRVVLVERRGGRTSEQAAEDAAREFRFSGRRVLVYGRNHTRVAVSDSAQDDLTRTISAVDQADDSPLHPMFAALTPGRSAYADVAHAGGTVRAYATRVLIADEPFTIVALQLSMTERAVLTAFLEAVTLAIPLALLLAGAGGYFLARRSFAPVLQMGSQAAQISSENLNARLRVRHTGDELDQLATIFNALLARLEDAFAQQRQFMADASHELRTPLAALRAEASVTLSRPRAPADYRSALEHARDEARRLSSIVDDLFTLARLDAGGRVLQRETFFLEEVVEDHVSRMRVLARRRGLTVEYRPTAEARCVGDPALIGRVVTNLLDNAIKYTAPGGRIRVELLTSEAGRAVRVSDTGAGIPEEARARVFDRFFRAEAARTRAETALNGAGLGLAIAHQIAQAHAGSLELTASGPQGTVFTLRLPAPGAR